MTVRNGKLRAVCPMCETGSPVDQRGLHHPNPLLAVQCPLWRRAHRPHKDVWVRRQQHLFEKNVVRVRCPEVPR